jgi:hypothetical protein
MEQMVKFHNKDKKTKLAEKRKSNTKKFNGKCFICNKTRNPTYGCRSGAWKMLISITPNLIVGSSFNFTISFHITFFIFGYNFRLIRVWKGITI